MKIIKKTKSISGKTLKETEAEIVLDNDKVYLWKSDEKNFSEKNLIEKDYKLYEILSGRFTAGGKIPYALQMIYVSSKCNLSCRICYEKTSEDFELSLEKIENIARSTCNQIFVLIGKEPTCRDNLPEIISTIKKYGHYVQLATNGLRLSDRNYVKELKTAGLDFINFSINSFVNDLNEEIHRKPCLPLKISALENLGKEEIKTSLSMILIRGRNENEIPDFIRYSISNLHYIKEYRIRSLQPIGDNNGPQPYCMSEIMTLVAAELKLDREDIIKEYLLWKQGIQFLKHLFSKGFKYYSQENRVCTFSFYINKHKRLPGLHKTLDFPCKGFFRNVKLIFCWLLFYGLNYIPKHMNFFSGLPFFSHFALLTITINCWPNINTIDLCENEKCISLMHRGKTSQPFCFSNILNLNS